MSESQHTCVVRVNLFLFLETIGQYEEHGSVGCAIMGVPSQPPVYKMGCYNDKNEYLCTASITTNNESGACIALQEGGYVCFKDELGKNWSMQFETEDRAIDFCAHVVVAMYGAAGHPEQSILACDVTSGNRDRSIFANDTIKVRFQSWVIQSIDNGKGLPVLGSRLDGNLQDQKPYTMDVPANHMSVLPHMKGFEGMVIGMGEEGSRLVVVPVKAKRGGGPHVHMCFYIRVVRKKNSSLTVTNQQVGIVSVPNSTIVDDYQNTKTVVVKENQVNLRRPQSPPSGFSGEQLLVIDRIRDQVHVLCQQLQETRRQLDGFGNDVKLYEKQVKPQSLASAQIEFSVQKLIQDTEEAKDLLEQKDMTLKQLEERNRELQKKVEKFSAAANLLAEEKKVSINNSNEEKLDMDRRIAQAQSELTRLQSEREDVSRHLSTVKGLLQVTDQDIKKVKNDLHIATISFQTSESKYAAAEESHAEEMSRRKILESKVVVLGDQLRGISEEIRTKDGQIEERRKKMETDKLHYTQILEDERNKAAADVRELRQELIDEVALRDRRYQEERHRVAHENFERGRIQGIEDGETEALLETDAATQELTLVIQRQRAEMHAMRIRLKSASEQNEADERRLNAQIEALQDTISSLTSYNAHVESELDILKTTKEAVEEEIFGKINTALSQLSHPIGRSDLLTLIHCVRVKKNIDYGFEDKRLEEQQQRLEEERRAVLDWVRNTVNGSSAPFPSTRTLHAPELPVPDPSSTTLLGESNLVNEIIDCRVDDEIRFQEECIQFDPDEMNRRYEELLKELIQTNPNTGLVPPTSSVEVTGFVPPTSSVEVTGLVPPTSSVEVTGLVPPTSSVEVTGLVPPTSSVEVTGLVPPTSSVEVTGLVPPTSSVDIGTYPNITSTAPFEVKKDEGQPQGTGFEPLPPQGSLFQPSLQVVPVVSKETPNKAVQECAIMECGREVTNHVGDAAVAASTGSGDTGKDQNNHVPPPPRRGVPSRNKKITFSDSETDSDSKPAWMTKTVQREQVKNAPKKSLFDDSDDSS